MNTVLVTGGTGLVGQGLKYASEQAESSWEWHFCSSKDADLTNYESTLALFERVKPTLVMHLAAQVGGLFKNMKYPVSMFVDNQRMNENVLRCCAETASVKKVVSCLSTCIFPDKTSYPIDETMVHNGPPHFSNEGYAYAKRMIDVLNRCYAKEYPGKVFTSVVPTNIFGPHDNYHLHDSHVLPGLMHKCFLAKKNNEKFVVWGTGSPLRQFLYSKDLGRLLLWVLESYEDTEPVVLSVPPEAEVSIKAVAESIAKAMGYTEGLTFDTEKADGQFKKTASNAKLMKLNPTFEFTPFDKAIQESCDWFVQNFDTCRK